MSSDKTLGDWLPIYAQRLEDSGVFLGHGTDNAWDEAAYLLLSALDLPADAPDETFFLVPDAAQRQRIDALLQQRIEERMPAAYLTHEGWFCGLSFYVDERVLIPRSPIAELIEQRFSPWIRSGQSVQRIVDMGTGSACIAIACAYAFPKANVDAVDISEDALAVARDNIVRHGMQGRVQAVTSDIWQSLQGRRYDLIVSNPPYVSHDDVAGLPAEYHHEPAMALAADSNGLALVEAILSGAAEHLSEAGVIVIEVGQSEEALVRAYPDVPFTWLAFERGGSGVLTLSAAEVRRWF